MRSFPLGHCWAFAGAARATTSTARHAIPSHLQPRMGLLLLGQVRMDTRWGGAGIRPRGAESPRLDGTVGRVEMAWKRSDFRVVGTVLCTPRAVKGDRPGRLAGSPIPAAAAVARSPPG